MNDMAGSAAGSFAALQAAFRRYDWTATVVAAAAYRQVRSDRPHGFVWGANALDVLERPDEAEALLRDAYRRFPDDGWVLSEFLAGLHERSAWAEVEAVTAAVLARPGVAPGLAARAFAAQLRVTKILREASIDTRAIKAAIAAHGHEERVIRELVDLCIRRRDFPQALAVWRHMRSLGTLAPAMLGDTVVRLFPAFHAEPEAAEFVAWIFRGQPADPWLARGIRAVRFIVNDTGVPEAARARLAAIYAALDKIPSDLVRAAAGSYFGDVLSEAQYAALMIALLPVWAAREFEDNLLNNLFYFASPELPPYPGAGDYGPRIRGAFRTAVAYFLDGRFALPDHDHEILFLLFVADLIDADTYERIATFVRTHLAVLSTRRDAAAGVLRQIVESAPTMPAPPILTRQPKVCIELAANVRGYKQAFATWHHLGLAGCETVYVAHLWNRVGRRVPWAAHSAPRTFAGHFLAAYLATLSEHGWSYVQAQYPALVRAITGSDVLDPEDIWTTYDPVALEFEDDRQPLFAGRPPHMKMYYSWFKAHQLALAHAGDADLFVRIRPDLYFTQPLGLDWAEFARTAAADNLIYVQWGRRFLNIGGPIGCGDQIAIGAAQGIGAYCDTFVDTQMAYAGELAGYPRKWQGHENCAYSTFHRGVRMLAHAGLPAINPMYDPPPLAPRLIHDCILAEMPWRGRTAVDEAWLAAAARDLAGG